MAAEGRKCDVCGQNRPPAQPCDVVVLRRILGPTAKGYAHPACFSQAQQEESH